MIRQVSQVITRPATQQAVRIEPFQQQDTAALVIFVEAIQDYERLSVPELKPGSEIGSSYTDLLMRTVAERSGLILLAKAGEQTIGFACAWIDEDDDPLLRDNARHHAYVSDIFVTDNWRRKGVARALLQAIENKMHERGCRRIRVCSKAANIAALTCYEAAGYRPYEVIFSKAIDGG
jgi:ribosomal protein S18 acetylase RimI-like enzyme